MKFMTFLIRGLTNISTASYFFNLNLKQLTLSQLYYNDKTEAWIKKTKLKGQSLRVY